MFYINLRKMWHIFINFCMSYMYLRKCTCFYMSYINQRKSWHLFKMFSCPTKEIYYMFLYVLHKSTTIMACPQKLLHVPEEIQHVLHVPMETYYVFCASYRHTILYVFETSENLYNKTVKQHQQQQKTMSETCNRTQQKK